MRLECNVTLKITYMRGTTGGKLKVARLKMQSAMQSSWLYLVIYLVYVNHMLMINVAHLLMIASFTPLGNRGPGYYTVDVAVVMVPGLPLSGNCCFFFFFLPGKSVKV